MRDQTEPTKNRLRAAETLLDRAFGRVKVANVVPAMTEDPVADRLDPLRALSVEQVVALVGFFERTQSPVVPVTDEDQN